MNVAVAEIGRLDDSGQMQPTEDGRLIRDWIVAALTAPAATTAAGADRVMVWHDGLPRPQKRVPLGAVAGQTAEDRAISAGALAQRVRADVVIYGHIEGSGAARRFVQEFYVAPRLQPEANESIGRYQLGEPIPLPASLRDADTLAREAVAGRVSTRANALFRLILALRADILGQHEDALALLRQAERELAGWAERGEGKETLYYFIARQALYLRRYDEATAASRRSQASNAAYPRAYIVLGGVWTQQAQGLPAAERLIPGGLFDQAEQAHLTAADLAVAGRDTRMEIIARLAAAAVHIAQGIAHYDLDTPAGDAEANRRLEQAATEVRPLLAPLEEIKQIRLLAQAYSYIGAARLEQGSLAHRRGDTGRAATAFRQARDALQGCIDQGPKAPEDRTLNVKIIAEMCQPYQQIALGALKELGGSP
jgi:tetratricopeptide (TPR) repeat protein